jgi:16S rRNA (cytosine1402-N4)-methyltransferase
MDTKVMDENSVHRTVLLNEAIEGLDLGSKKAPIVVDATVGGGGHLVEICKRYKGVKILGLDEDATAIKRAETKVKNFDCEINFIKSNFRELDAVLKKEKISCIDGIIFDLGLSSDQLEISGRGFSFKRDEPLLMTFKNEKDVKPEDLTAFDIVNTWSEENLADIIYGFGEEKFARKIAAKIVERREKKKIKTTFELVDVINESVSASYRRGKIHPATKTFQAIRIAVNNELETLQIGLNHAFDALRASGRMSVITFHSLEDRIVKKFYKMKVENKEAKMVNKKVILASEKEIIENPRARSAKLRILEKFKQEI